MKLYGDLLGYLTNLVKKNNKEKKAEAATKENLETTGGPDAAASQPEPAVFQPDIATAQPGAAVSQPAETEVETEEETRLDDPAYKELMDTSLYELKMKFFAYYTLNKAGFNTIGDVCHPRTDKDAYRLKYLRKKVKKELISKLEKYGVRPKVD